MHHNGTHRLTLAPSNAKKVPIFKDKQGLCCTREAYLKAMEICFLSQGLGGLRYAVRRSHKRKVHGFWAHFRLFLLAKAKKDS